MLKSEVIIVVNAAEKQSKRDLILTGSPLPTLLRIAIPIVLGNIFQQLYNIVDAIVVGHFLGDLPLVGISIATPVMDILYALILGASVGVGVLMGQFSGASDWDNLKTANSTALLGGSVITIFLAASGFLFSRKILLLQGNSAQACEQAMAYLSIILSGLIFCFFYNYYASLLRSYGDSQTPFAVLLISSTLHALLDVLLCGVLNFGIRGVAFSTVLCQLFSSVCLILYTYLHYSVLSLSRAKICFSKRMGFTLLGYAWAAALQQAVICIGRLLVQGTITNLGDQVITGYNMGMRAEQFIFCFSQGYAAAMVVCLSQNFGQGNNKRIQQFFYTTLKVGAVMGVITVSLVRLFRYQIIGIFSSNPAVIEAGVQYTGLMSFFYFFPFFGEAIQGLFRGLGRIRLTMIASLLQVIIRVILSYLLVPTIGIPGICISVVTGWILLNVIEGTYSIITAHRLMEAKE